MTQKKLLIGSLSSDLYRVVNLTIRGSFPAADRFFIEAQKWAFELSNVKVKKYIKKIIDDINTISITSLHSQETIEKLLMYSVLLQNYSLHL